MVEYTDQEKKIVNMCKAFFRKEVMPDTPMNQINVLDAVEFSHSRGQFIRRNAYFRRSRSNCEREKFENPQTENP